MTHFVGCMFTGSADADAVSALNSGDSTAAAQAFASADSSGNAQSTAKAIADAFTAGVPSFSWSVLICHGGQKQDEGACSFCLRNAGSILPCMWQLHAFDCLA